MERTCEYTVTKMTKKYGPKQYTYTRKYIVHGKQGRKKRKYTEEERNRIMQVWIDNRCSYKKTQELEKISYYTLKNLIAGNYDD